MKLEEDDNDNKEEKEEDDNNNEEVEVEVEDNKEDKDNKEDNKDNKEDEDNKDNKDDKDSKELNGQPGLFRTSVSRLKSSDEPKSFVFEYFDLCSCQQNASKICHWYRRKLKFHVGVAKRVSNH